MSSISSLPRELSTDERHKLKLFATLASFASGSGSAAQQRGHEQYINGVPACTVSAGGTKHTLHSALRHKDQIAGAECEHASKA
eukprot:scaffold48561_cov20-Tisochrysis_lutea.AAC.3